MIASTSTLGWCVNITHQFCSSKQKKIEPFFKHFFSYGSYDQFREILNCHKYIDINQFSYQSLSIERNFKGWSK